MFVPTGGLGLHYRASPSFEVAAAYSAPIPIRAKGTSNTVLGEALREPIPGMPTEIIPLEGSEVRCEAGGQVGALKTCVDIDLPMTATLGARWIARDGSGSEIGDLELDVKWENWSRASNYDVVVDGKNTLLNTPLERTVIRHGLRDTVSVRLGGSGVIQRGATKIEVRAGVSYDSAAAPVSWTRLDVDGAERFSASTGVGIFLGKYRLDVGVGVVDSPRRLVRDVPIDDQQNMDSRVQPDINVPLQGPDSQPYHPHNAGNYDSSYLIGTVGLTAIW
jgi:long-subunit fatty acid transport protein